MVNKRTIKASDKRMLKGIEMKEKILHSVLEIVGLKGIQNLSASTISEKVGISKANIFHHFKSMKEIRVESALYFLKIIRPRAIEEKEYSDPRTYLIELMQQLAHFLKENSALVKGYNTICNNETLLDEEFLKLVDRTVQNNKGMVKKKLREIMKLDENNKATEEILFCLDIAREGYITYLADSFMKERVLASWATMVDLILEKIREIY
jgi:AcrR family transcriptional regulator